MNIFFTSKVCEWILANKDTQLFQPEGTTVEAILSQDISQMLQEASLGENMDLPNSDEPERLARAVLIIADAHQLATEKG